MPKKSSKDGSDAKKRRGSTKDSRGGGNSMDDVLMPPTPKAKHLFASNPFDDPIPGNIMGSGPSYIQGSPRLMNPPMHMPGMSPNYMPKGPYSPAGWKPSPSMHGPVGPGWQPVPGESMPPMGQGYPCPAPMDYNRLPMHNHHGPVKHSPYGGPIPGPECPREGPPFEHMHQDSTRMAIPATMAHSAGSGYQKLIGRKQEKSRKNDSNAWGTKTKKTKANPSPVTKPAEEWPIESEKQSPPVAKNIAPHAALPILPQTCLECSRELEEPLEDTICCLASCKGWYHRTCTGLTKAAHECLCGEELALWACDRCLGSREITSVRLRKPNQASDGPVPATVSVKS